MVALPCQPQPPFPSRSLSHNVLSYRFPYPPTPMPMLLPIPIPIIVQRIEMLKVVLNRDFEGIHGKWENRYDFLWVIEFWSLRLYRSWFDSGSCFLEFVRHTRDELMGQSETVAMSCCFGMCAEPATVHRIWLDKAGHILPRNLIPNVEVFVWDAWLAACKFSRGQTSPCRYATGC